MYILNLNFISSFTLSLVEYCLKLLERECYKSLRIRYVFGGRYLRRPNLCLSLTEFNLKTIRSPNLGVPGTEPATHPLKYHKTPTVTRSSKIRKYGCFVVKSQHLLSILILPCSASTEKIVTHTIHAPRDITQQKSPIHERHYTSMIRSSDSVSRPHLR